MNSIEKQFKESFINELEKWAIEYPAGSPMSILLSGQRNDYNFTSGLHRKEWIHNRTKKK